MDLEPAELLTAMQRAELHHEREARHFPAQPLDQLNGAHHRSTGGQKVVHDQDPLPRLDGIAVDLQGGRPVLQGVLDLNRVGR